MKFWCRIVAGGEPKGVNFAHYLPVFPDVSPGHDPGRTLSAAAAQLPADGSAAGAMPAAYQALIASHQLRPSDALMLSRIGIQTFANGLIRPSDGQDTESAGQLAAFVGAVDELRAAILDPLLDGFCRTHRSDSNPANLTVLFADIYRQVQGAHQPANPIDLDDAWAMDALVSAQAMLHNYNAVCGPPSSKMYQFAGVCLDWNSFLGYLWMRCIEDLACEKDYFVAFESGIAVNPARSINDEHIRSLLFQRNRSGPSRVGDLTAPAVREFSPRTAIGDWRLAAAHFARRRHLRLLYTPEVTGEAITQFFSVVSAWTTEMDPISFALALHQQLLKIALSESNNTDTRMEYFGYAERILLQPYDVGNSRQPSVTSVLGNAAVLLWRKVLLYGRWAKFMASVPDREDNTDWKKHLRKLRREALVAQALLQDVHGIRLVSGPGEMSTFQVDPDLYASLQSQMSHFLALDGDVELRRRDPGGALPGQNT